MCVCVFCCVSNQGWNVCAVCGKKSVRDYKSVCILILIEILTSMLFPLIDLELHLCSNITCALGSQYQAIYNMEEVCVCVCVC